MSHLSRAGDPPSSSRRGGGLTEDSWETLTTESQRTQRQPQRHNQERKTEATTKHTKHTKKDKTTLGFPFVYFVCFVVTLLCISLCGCLCVLCDSVVGS